MDIISHLCIEHFLEFRTKNNKYECIVVKASDIKNCHKCDNEATYFIKYYKPMYHDLVDDTDL